MDENLRKMLSRIAKIPLPSTKTFRKIIGCPFDDHQYFVMGCCVCGKIDPNAYECLGNRVFLILSGKKFTKQTREKNGHLLES